MGGGSSADGARGVSSAGGDTTASVRSIGGAKVGVASVIAETAPHGPPSHNAITATHESNAIPTGPRITQATSRTSVSHRYGRRDMAAMVARGAGWPAGLDRRRTSDHGRPLGPPKRSTAPSGGRQRDRPITGRANFVRRVSRGRGSAGRRVRDARCGDAVRPRTPRDRRGPSRCRGAPGGAAADAAHRGQSRALRPRTASRTR